MTMEKRLTGKTAIVTGANRGIGKAIAERLAHGEKIALPAEMPQNVEPAYAAAFVDFCQMLLNSNEFVYRN